MDLISKYCERGVCSDDKKTCKKCGQKINSKPTEAKGNGCKGSYDDMPDEELHYFLMGDEEEFDKDNFDREGSIEQAEDLCNEENPEEEEDLI